MPGGYGEGSARDDWGSVDPLAPSVTNGQISPEQWAEYQARRRRDAILGTLGILGATTGLGALGGAMGGGGSAAASSAGGALPPIAGGAPWAVTPYATSATMAGTGLAGGAAGAAGGAGLLGGMSARDIAGIAASLGGTIGGAMQGRNQSMAPNSMATDPQMKELLDMMMGRVRKSEPLYDSVLAMANGLLPTQYQKGGGGMG